MPKLVTLWDRYPLSRRSWRTFQAYLCSPDDNPEGLPGVTIAAAIANGPDPQATFIVRAKLPEAMLARGVRDAYLPGPGDLELIRRHFPDLSDPTQPDWDAVAARLMSRGLSRRELARCTAGELLELLGDPPTKPRRKRAATLDEAEIKVRCFLEDNKARWDKVARDEVAKATGLSAGLVSKTAAWRAFQKRRAEERKRQVRTIPLTDRMQAVIADPKASDPARAAELAQLIREQERDREADEAAYRRHKRRHDGL